MQLLLVRLQVLHLLLHILLLLLGPGLLMLDFLGGATALRSNLEHVRGGSILDYIIR